MGGVAEGVLGVCGCVGSGWSVFGLYLPYRCHIALVVVGGWLFGSDLVVLEVVVVGVVVGKVVGVVVVVVVVVVGVVVWVVVVVVGVLVAGVVVVVAAVLVGRLARERP